MSLFRRKRKLKTKGEGNKPVVKKPVASKTWYGEYLDPVTKKTVRVNLRVAHRAAAEEKLRQIKRERAEESLGMRPPAAQIANMGKRLDEHAQDYLHFLEGKGDSVEYIYNVGNCLRLAFIGCGWKVSGDANLDSYYIWRTSLRKPDKTGKPGKAAKTIREYQAALSAFFKWLKDLGRIPFNPLENVARVPVDGRKQRVRRVVSAVEFQRLLEVAGERALAYHVVVNMGLRRGDGDGLTWGDLNLDGPSPSWISRATVAKVPVENCFAP